MLETLIKFKRPFAVLTGGILAMGLFSTTHAQEAETLEDLTTAINTGWLMLAAILVFLMQAGFALLEAGFVRAKNVTNILMKNILDCSMGAIAFWAVGFGLAYGVGDSTNGFVGTGNFFLSGFDDYATWFFQFAFAATAATIVSGAMAERTKFTAYLFYTVFITAIIYPVVVHWVWDSSGWLTAFTDDPIATNGYIDFAGSGVVHMVGGFAGLMGAMIVGPRLGKYTEGGVNPIPGHNVGMAVLGMFILWFGWYGFNPGSTLGLTDGFAALAAKVAVTTTLSAGAGLVMMTLLAKLRTGKYDLGLAINGALGGLVAITAGTATVEPWAAVVIGAIGAAIVMLGVDLLDRLKIDDPVGAVAVHGFAGVWGVLAVGLFSTQAGIGTAFAETTQYGLLVGGGVEQLGIQALGAASIIAWTCVTSGAVFLTLKYTVGLRVSEEEELRGLDLDEHGLEAYPEFAPAAEGGMAIFGGEHASAPVMVDRPATST